MATKKKSAATQHALLVCAMVSIMLLPPTHALVNEVRLAILPALPPLTTPKDVLIPGEVNVVNTHSSSAAGWGLPFGLISYLLVWMIGSMFILGRYLIGLGRVRAWAKNGESFTNSIGSFQTVISSHVSVPMTAWIGYSVILVPESWRTWSKDRQEAVILHESAHIRRGDWLTQLIARLTCAALWPNPIIWILARKSRFLAERAADDAVLARGIPPTSYAQILLQTAREANASLPQTSVCMAQGPNVTRRIELILHNKTNRATTSRTGLVIGAMLILATSLPTAVMAITNRDSPEAPSQEKAKVEPIQIVVDCTVLKPGVSFSETGLKVFAETKTVHSGKKSASTLSNGLVYSFPIDSATLLLSKWKKEGKIVSHPVVMTLNGQQATISTLMNADNSQTMKFLPTINSKGELTMGFDYDLKQAKSTSFNEYITYTSKTPGTVVISRSMGSSKDPEVLAVVTVKVRKER